VSGGLWPIPGGFEPRQPARTRPAYAIAQAREGLKRFRRWIGIKPSSEGPW